MFELLYRNKMFT